MIVALILLVIVVVLIVSRWYERTSGRLLPFLILLLSSQLTSTSH